MIDPSSVTLFDRTPAQLQEWWLFSIVVAGKQAYRQAKQLDAFLNSLPWPKSALPFDRIRAAMRKGVLSEKLRESRLGQYVRIERAFRESVELDVATASIEELERVHGVGPKTARMFVMHSRPNTRLAALDTHILRYMRDRGISTPKSTPTGKKYTDLEQKFLQLADEAGMTPSDFDLKIWNESSLKTHSPSTP